MDPMQAGLMAPQLPKAPSSYGKLSSRLVGNGVPTLLTVSTVFSTVMAVLRYVQADMIAAGSFTAVSIVTCVVGLCFWRYVGAKAIEQSAGDMQETVDHLSSLVTYYKDENQNLAREVEKFDALTLEWTKKEEINETRYGDHTKLLAITAEDFGKRVEELEKFVQLYKNFEEAIKNLKAKISEFQNMAPAIKSSMGQIVEQFDALAELPDKLDVKITKLGTIDDELIRAISELINYITKFEKGAKRIVAIYNRTKTERDEFKQKVKDFEDRNNDLANYITRFETAVDGFDKDIQGAKEFITLLTDLKTKTIEPMEVMAPVEKRKKRVHKHREAIS